jgi:hypothetical protein
VGSVAHPCSGNQSANVKLLKLGSVTGIQVASFRKRLRNVGTVPWDSLRKVFKYDLLRDLEF